jgi:hypothetical protein
LATLDIEPPEALWPETKGHAASLARIRGHPLHGAGGHQAPELPPTANGRHQQQPANMKLGRPLNLRATHENILVMRRSLDDDEDQGVVVPLPYRKPLWRASCKLDRPVGAYTLPSRRGSPTVRPASDGQADPLSRADLLGDVCVPEGRADRGSWLQVLVELL